MKHSRRADEAAGNVDGDARGAGVGMAEKGGESTRADGGGGSGPVGGPVGGGPGVDDAMADGAGGGAVSPPPLGQTAARGMSLVIGFSIFSKLLTMLSQVVLAALLSKADFGLYSTVLAISSIGLAVRDGGATEWIIQRGLSQFNVWIGPVFWIAMAFNALVATVLCVAAPFVAYWSGSGTLGWMVVILALGQVIGTLGTTLAARLRMELRFATIVRIGGVSQVIRPVVSSAAAALGAGATSFVLPLIVSPLYDIVRLWQTTRFSPWRCKPDFARWGEILRDTRWIMVNNAASALMNVGDYAVLAFILSADQRGVYLFAYQLVVQSALLLAANVTQVMFPTLAALKDDPVRFRAAMLRTLRALMLVTAPATVGTGVVMAPVEDLIFGGRWDDVVWVVIVGAVLFPPRAIIPLSLSSLMAQGQFRANSVITIVVGSAMMIGAAVGAIAGVWFDQWWSGGLLDAMGVARGGFAGAIAAELMFSVFASGALGAAVGCGVMRAVSSTWGILRAAKLARIRRRETLDAILGSWTLSVVAMVPALALDLFVIHDVHPLIRAVVAGGVYGVVWLALTRTLLEGDLRDLLTAVPTRVRGPFRRLMLLKEKA